MLRTFAATAACVLAMPALVSPQLTEKVVTRSAVIDGLVGVRNLHREGTDVVCELVNLSGETLDDVRLVVSDEFHWANERAPGSDDPSRVRVLVVSQPIPPHASERVRAEFPPRPERPDGHFEPRVDVVGLEIWSSGGEAGEVR